MKIELLMYVCYFVMEVVFSMCNNLLRNAMVLFVQVYILTTRTDGTHFS